MTRLNNYADNRLETSFYLRMVRYYMLIIETIEDDDNGHAQIGYCHDVLKKKTTLEKIRSVMPSYRHFNVME